MIVDREYISGSDEARIVAAAVTFRTGSIV